MPEYAFTVLVIVAAFAAAAIVVAVAHAIVHRALDAMDVVSAESRKALHDRATRLIRRSGSLRSESLRSEACRSRSHASVSRSLRSVLA